MEGIQRVTNYGKGFVEYQLQQATTGYLLFFVLYNVLSIYFYRYLSEYPLLKWMYLGSIVIFIGTIYGDGIQPMTPPPTFKLARN